MQFHCKGGNQHSWWMKRRRVGSTPVVRRNLINPRLIYSTCSRRCSFVWGRVILIIPERLFSKRVARRGRGKQRKQELKERQSQALAICASLSRRSRSGVRLAIRFIGWHRLLLGFISYAEITLRLLNHWNMVNVVLLSWTIL